MASVRVDPARGNKASGDGSKSRFFPCEWQMKRHHDPSTTALFLEVLMYASRNPWQFFHPSVMYQFNKKVIPQKHLRQGNQNKLLSDEPTKHSVYTVRMRAPLVWEPQNSVSHKLSRLDVPSSYHFLSILNSILEFRILVQFVTILLQFCTLSVSSQLMLSVTDCRLSETHHSW